MTYETPRKIAKCKTNSKVFFVFCKLLKKTSNDYGYKMKKNILMHDKTDTFYFGIEKLKMRKLNCFDYFYLQCNRFFD